MFMPGPVGMVPFQGSMKLIDGAHAITRRATSSPRFFPAIAALDPATCADAIAALYRLDRGNVVVPDPDDPAVSRLVDAQRTKGFELGLNGYLTRAWNMY